MTEPASGQSGGIDNRYGTISTGGGDVFGGNKTTTITNTTYAPAQIQQLWQPVADAIQNVPPVKQAAAAAKLDDLKQETAKGDKAEDSTIARLVKALVALAPSAVSAIAGAFGTPILSGIAGPVTKFVLNELGAGEK